MNKPLILTVALLLSFMRPVHGAEIVQNVGPLVLQGEFGPLKGPKTNGELHFDRPGWLLDYTVHIIGADGKNADGRDLLCHASLHAGPPTVPGPAPAGTLHLILEQGQNEIRFPEGFGVPVDSATPYLLNLQLQNRDKANNGEYSFQVKVHVAYEGEGPAPKSLLAFHVDIAGGNMSFRMRPGAHDIRHEFSMPYSGTIHFAKFHIHEFVKTISLIDVESGRAVLKLSVANDAKGLPVNTPHYSSVEGIPTVAGKRYAFVIEYDNPLNSGMSSMGLMHLYVHPSAPTL